MNKDSKNDVPALGYGSIVWPLMVSFVVYTGAGAVVGILWAYGSAPLGVPHLTLLQFLALWWAFMLVAILQYSTFSNIFKASMQKKDDLKKYYESLGK